MRDDQSRELGERPNQRGDSEPARRLYVSLEDVLANRQDADLRELYEFWSEGQRPEPGQNGDGTRQRVLHLMREPERVERLVGSLGKRLLGVFEALIDARAYSLSFPELAGNHALANLTQYDLEACLAALARRALVDESTNNRFDRLGERRLVVPRELGDTLLRARRAKRRGVFDTLTLRGHLDALYADPARAARTPAQRVREMYKMYSAETAAAARVDRLPDGVKQLVERAVLEFGGILPRQMFERMNTDLPHWNGRRWNMILEQSLVGTVQHLELSKCGIHHADETLIVFHEVALAWLKRVAVPGDPDRPHEALSLGVDIYTNVARFLAFLQEHHVRYTVKGEIFKTTEKKILQHLIPNPGRELAREEVLQFIFQFCKREGLVDGSGERTLAVTSEGRTWGSTPLEVKLDRLMDFAVEERVEGTEHFHQTRLRRMLLRMLKRVEPDTWYDIMYLPFLARNQYLSGLDEARAEEFFAERVHSGSYSPNEDVQRLAWSLVKWVRQRLYLMGVVELGYDEAKRPVALKLTASGARLLGLIPGEDEPAQSLGNLVVTPDFEVVLFKTGDDADLMHDLDRFCLRERAEETVHFRIQESSVRRAMIEGMRLDRILETLESNSRTPVPQNVTYSIRDWARSLGRMTLTPDLILACENAEVLARFRSDPGARSYIGNESGESKIQLLGKITPKRMRGLLRDLGYVVELTQP